MVQDRPLEIVANRAVRRDDAVILPWFVGSFDRSVGCDVIGEIVAGEKRVMLCPAG